MNQELGRHLQWSKGEYSILKQCKMSRTLHVNIFIYMVYFYVQTDLAKIKGSTRGLESIVVIIEYSLTFSYHLRRLDYASVTPDHTKNTKDCQLNTLKVLF